MLTFRDASGRNTTASALAPFPVADSTMGALRKTLDLLLAPFNGVSGGGDVTILAAAPSGQTTRVHSMRFNVSAAGNYQLRIGGVLIETFQFFGAGSLMLDFRTRPYYVGSGAITIGFDGAGYKITGAIEYAQSA